MPQHSEFYQLFNSYFWLIFPIGTGVIAMFGTWLHHRRAQQALEALQSFAAQGKEVPPELLALIQPKRREQSPVQRAQTMTLVAFILAAMAVSFVVLATAIGGSVRSLSGLYFVAVMFAGVAVAFFVAAWITRRDAGRADHR